MITKLTTSMVSAVDQMSRNFSSVYTGGLSQLVNDVLDTISNGAIGIKAAAPDIDSVAAPGGAFAVDLDNTLGLTFAYQAGRFNNGFTITSVAAGSILLAASATNYVELTNDGVMHTNTASFTAGSLPLYKVQTNGTGILSSGTTLTGITNAKAVLTFLGAGSVKGSILSATAASRAAEVKTGTLTATSTYYVIAPCTGVLTSATLICPTGVATSNTNYWQMSAVELLQTGAGTQALLAASPANSTQLTGGAAVVANIPLPLTLIALSSGTERNVTEGDVIAVTFTMTGAPSALTNSILRLKFAFSI